MENIIGMANRKYDYLIVGAGLFGATFAKLAHSKGKRCLVLEKRGHLGGNVYCVDVDGITVHKYGPHIFHTNSEKVWKFVNSFVCFEHYTNSPVAFYKGRQYNLPFNMNTFFQLWGTSSPEGARKMIDSQRCNAIARLREKGVFTPRNMEEYVLSELGADLYNILVKGYSEKQWGRLCTSLPSSFIKRLPVRFVYDNNYFNDRWQGIPSGGYNVLVGKLLEGVEVKMDTDFLEDRAFWQRQAECVVYTGRLDSYFNYCLGRLNYRTLHFEHQYLDMSDFQGNAVVNYTDKEIPFTRIVEHKHFCPLNVAIKRLPYTVITREYPGECMGSAEPYYPISDSLNERLAARYVELAKMQENVIFGGRLGEYKYFNMDEVIERAMNCFEKRMVRNLNDEST